MAKKVIKNMKDSEIYSPFYSGKLSLMPTEAKDKIKEKDPKLFKQIFETK